MRLHMTIGVQSDLDARMAETFRDYLGILTIRQ